MKRIFIVFIIASSPGFLFSQDALFSMYNSFPLYNNMAMAGSKGCSRVVTGTRLQWLNLDGGYKTYYISYDQYSRHLSSGIGLEYYRNDEANGMIKNDFFHFAIAPAFSIGKRADDSLRHIVIKPAMSFGFLTYKFDWNKYTFGDWIDPAYGFIYGGLETKNIDVVTAPDFGAGISAYGKNFFAGFYYNHFTEPELSVIYGGAPLVVRMVFHGGYLLQGYKWLGKFTLSPSFVYEKQGGRKRTDIALTAKYWKVILGAGFRSGSAIVFMGGFEHKFIKIGYAYDLNTTHAHKAVGGTHEIMMGFNFFCRAKLKNIRTLDFPML